MKTLARMPIDDSRRIRAAISKYADTGVGDVVRLEGVTDLSRLRVGGWRVLFGDDGLVVAVEKIAPRGDIYKRI
ncbi:MAG: hypothetical protein H7839_00550 [Magnetococcus sp. YQC-5]